MTTKNTTGCVYIHHMMMASWRQKEKNSGPWVQIFRSSSTDNGAFIPAVDVTIYGESALLALRAAIDAALDTNNSGEKS